MQVMASTSLPCRHVRFPTGRLHSVVGVGRVLRVGQLLATCLHDPCHVLLAQHSDAATQHAVELGSIPVGAMDYSCDLILPTLPLPAIAEYLRHGGG